MDCTITIGVLAPQLANAAPVFLEVRKWAGTPLVIQNAGSLSYAPADN